MLRNEKGRCPSMPHPALRPPLNPESEAVRWRSDAERGPGDEGLGARCFSFEAASGARGPARHRDCQASIRRTGHSVV